MSEGEARKYVVRDFDDAIAMIDALEEFFDKVRKAHERFKRLVKQLSLEEDRPRFSFTSRGGRLEEEFMRMVMEEYLKRRGLSGGGELSPEEEKEIDRVVDKLRRGGGEG